MREDLVANGNFGGRETTMVREREFYIKDSFIIFIKSTEEHLGYT